MLKSDILYDLKDRPFTLSGKIDGYIKHKDSFTIVDFKTTKINENKIDAYATQLQSYALMMEKPREGSLKLSPIKRLGIFCFEPSDITELDKHNCNMVMDTKWFEIPRDDKDLIGYITKIQDVLLSKSNQSLLKLVVYVTLKGDEIMQNFNNSEIKVTEVISFILEQFRNEKIIHDLEVTSELILIARILHQRFKINNGIKVNEDKSVILARDEVLKEIKNDEYYQVIKNFIKDYKQFRDKSIN